jgi:hypothetical protein
VRGHMRYTAGANNQYVFFHGHIPPQDKLPR